MTYSGALALGRQRYGRPNRNLINLQIKHPAIGPISSSIVLLVLACLLGLLYLTQVTKTNSYSYHINDLKTKQAQLKTDASRLAIESARLQSVESLKNTPAAKSLVAISPIAVRN